MSLKLLSAFRLGPLELKHRVVMAPMTRTRAGPNGVPNDLNALYYQQRSSPGGLIITEGTAPSLQGKGYFREPGLYTEEHVEGWKKVTKAVHDKGGYIFLQMMHCGRVSHSLICGETPVAPSAIQMKDLVHVPWTDGKDHPSFDNKVPYEVPRSLREEEMGSIVDQFCHSAKLAKEAGFDGVELHGGNGYLLHSFLAPSINKRTDNYGGSAANRNRLVIEVLKGVCAIFGEDRVGIRFHPGVSFAECNETPEEVQDNYGYFLRYANSLNLAFVHVCHLARVLAQFTNKKVEEIYPFDVEEFFRNTYKGNLIINATYTPETAEKALQSNKGDAVSFGTLFLSNPDLPKRIEHNSQLDLSGNNVRVWYGNFPQYDEKGYTDFPSLHP